MTGTLDIAAGFWEDDGFYLTLTTDEGEDTTVRVHGLSAAQGLLKAVEGLREWVADAEEARVEGLREWVAALENDAYDLDDPKHPTYHDRMSDLYDSREGK